MKRPMSKIRAQGDTATVLIYEDIGEGFFGGLGAKAFVEQLQALGDVHTINVRINSDGGSVFEGIAIYNALKDHPARVNVTIDGIAASIASVIAMAGDTVQMQPTATMMIHNAHGLVAGDCNKLREIADIMEMINGQMVIAYQRSKLAEDSIRAIMDAETWYTADAAVAAGWADSLVEKPVKMAASAAGYDLSGFAHVPGSLALRVKAEKAAAADGDCTCPCPACMSGDCASCTDPGCDCPGCTCEAASAKAETSEKTGQNDPVIAKSTENLLITAQMEAENLRLAELF